MLTLTMLPKRISNPFMNKLLSSTLIHALRCPSPQPPLDLLVCLRRFLFLHNFLDVSTDTLSTSLLLSIIYGFLIDFQVDLYIFILIVSSHIHCLLCFSPFISPSLCFMSFHRCFLSHRFLHSIGLNFCFLSYMVVVLCTVRIVRSH